MPSWPPPRFSSWSCDESNRLILLKVPEQIKIECLAGKPLTPPSLSTLDKPCQPPRIAPTLPSLPREIHFTILQHLPPVDRVCLALTCRRLCNSVLSSPRLTPETWLRFTNITDFSNRYWNPNATFLTLAPEHYQLCQRLAHGWVNKKSWRYCWKCHKILPRNEDWWWKTRDDKGDKRLQGRINPRWSVKTGVEKEDWLTWNKKKKLRWLVNVWCKAGWEDSSIVGCEWCRDKLYTEDAERVQTEITERKNMVINGNKDMDVLDFVGTRHPVECPSCLEKEMTFSWRPPKRVVLKKTFWSICGCLRDWCVGILWCVGSTIIGIFMLIWQCGKWAIMLLFRWMATYLPGGQSPITLCGCCRHV